MTTIRTLDGRTIITAHEPDGSWSAIEDDSYDGPGSPWGEGASEDDAVLNLLQQLEDRADLAKAKAALAELGRRVPLAEIIADD